MKSQHSSYNESNVLEELKHYLPSQAPLKDFIHHNTLHAFQHLSFYKALNAASTTFGYKVFLDLEEYRAMYRSGKIQKEILEKIIFDRKGKEHLDTWKTKVLYEVYNTSSPSRIGTLRANWQNVYHLNLDALVHPILFRVLCSYLDQGISIWNFPTGNKGFLSSIKELEKNSFTSFFRSKRVKTLLSNDDISISELLNILVKDESLYEHYLFDQQFAHQGWSGIVSSIEGEPQSLLDSKKITLKELIIFELLLEIDALDSKFKNAWSPLGTQLKNKPVSLFSDIQDTELSDILNILHDAFEWSYYDGVLAGIKAENSITEKSSSSKSFQAMFCIDDRETSLRGYLESNDKNCETFATPGFFGTEFFYKPEHGKFYTKLCPAPVTPRYLIKEAGASSKQEKDLHFTKHTHSLFRGWIISQTVGFWSAFRLFLNIFRPSITPATAVSFRHMNKTSRLIIEADAGRSTENGLQVGFTVDEMAQRVEGVLKSIGLVKNFAPIVYAIGHGSSSVNNPHYTAYDCGACCGRPGSVNARVFSYMANHKEVRKILAASGLIIPEETEFIGGLHDTTRDEILFFDEDALSPKNKTIHAENEKVFSKALKLNSKERSRRFELIDTTLHPEKIHEKVLKRSVSLFEPRPELNHATNTLCIVGRRGLTKDLFLDRRSFMNSYDYRIDPDGKYLFSILKAAAPVCGGINLEYFFSRVDNKKLGAGTKLPHNVMGLIGVANGIDGDLRPGLPSQMIEVHDPIRLLIIVEHFPDIVLQTIKTAPETYEWFINEWVHLIVTDPETHELYYFKNGAFTNYQPLTKTVEKVNDITPILESSGDNLPVYLIK